MDDREDEALIVSAGPDQTKTPTDDAPAVGRWYKVKGNEREDGQDPPWLGCAVHIGSNYVKVKGVHADGSKLSSRIHFDEFWQWCEYVPDPQPIIDEHMLVARKRVNELMNEIKALTARLGVGQHAALGSIDGETQAIAVRTSGPVEEYKEALVKAKEKTLPDLFEKLREANETLAGWMHTQLIPLKAQIGSLDEVKGQVEDRIFNVELYAGLVENIKKVRNGKPAPVDTKIRLLQRRCYMDEECLAGYEHGGMSFENIKDFDKWLAKPANFTRILPFERCVVAFRVRRYDRDEPDMWRLSDLIALAYERQYDKWTFLYIRNGEQLFRMDTKLEFDEQLFPDANHKLFTADKLWAKDTADEMNDLITDADYKERVAKEDAHEAWLETLPEKERRKHDRHYSSFGTKRSYSPFTPDNVYYDDIAKVLADAAKKHNRIALILQGLLDRSPVFHPHPPWQLWTGEGFDAAIERIFDDSRALSAGEKPDFEKYRAKLNARLTDGSLTVGQERAWLVREAQRENARLDSDYRSRQEYRHKHFRPDGDPGPGKLAYVHKYRASDGACTYVWQRKKRGRGGYAIAGTCVDDSITTGEENLLNVDAYTPGDFHIFFDDPRTRREYLQWAPMLLEAEECHAGNRELKPRRRLAPVGAREPVVRTEERPLELDKKAPRKPRPSPSEKYEGKLVSLNFDMKTNGGTQFKAGELMRVTSYNRRRLSLTALKGKGRSIFGVSVTHVELVGQSGPSRL